MTVLITGPTGPIGQYVAERSLAGDEPVRVLALPETLHRVPYRNRVEIIPGSLDDQDAVREAADGVEVVYHTAQLAPPPYRDPEEMQDVNVDGTRRLLDACIGWAGRFVLMSTVTVYTPHRTPDTWPVREEAERLAHGNEQLKAYGQSMIDAEDAVLDAHERHGLEFCILRPTVVCGRSARFVERLVTELLRQPEKAGVINALWGTMQWVHGTDMGHVTTVAGRHPAAANEIFTVAGAEPVTSFDILAELWSIMNPAEEGNPYQEMAEAQRVGMCKFDYSKIRNALGFEPTVTIRQCLEEVLGRLEFYTAASIDLPRQPEPETL